MLIQVKPSSFHQSGSGAISGVIYLELDGFYFPDASWSDLPIAILAQWVLEYRKLARGITTSVDCCFMDGPFFFRLDRQGEEILVRCFRNAKKLAEVGLDFATSMKMFESSLLVAARAALAACRERAWVSTDIENLAAQLDQLPPTA